MTRRERRRLFKIVAPIAVVVGAVIVAGVLIANRPEVDRAQQTVQGVLVEVERAGLRPHRLDVEAQGTVLPAREITVQPQVSGRVFHVSPKLEPGGLFRQGEVLFEIDSSDYRLAIAAQESALAQAEAQLELERGRRSVAEREWELFRDELDSEQQRSALALREPQLKSAQAAVETARAALERARLDLDRTVVRAPFNAFVRSESVDPGQTVSPSSRLVELVGTDRLWVRAAVDTAKLSFVEVPRREGGGGSPAMISYDAGGGAAQLAGRVVRLLGDLDPAGRMARLLIEVDDPFGLSETGRERSGLPLLVDSYVDVVIAGSRTEELIEIPRGWLREGNQVWVFADDQTLDIRDVEVVWRLEDTVLVGDGLTPDDRIVTSSLVTPVDGMELRLGRDRSQEPELELDGVEESAR